MPHRSSSRRQFLRRAGAALARRSARAPGARAGEAARRHDAARLGVPGAERRLHGGAGQGLLRRGRPQRRHRSRQGLGQHRPARRQQGDAVRLLRRLRGRQQRVQGHEHQHRRRHLPAQSDRGDRAGRLRHQDAEGSRGKEHRDHAGLGPVPAVAGLRQGLRLDAGKIRVVSIDPAGTPPALITGQVPAIAGFAQGQVPSVEIRGNKKTRVFWYADCGVNAVSNGIVVHNDLIKEDPALIKRLRGREPQGLPLWAPASRRAGRDREEILAHDRARHRAARGRAVVADLGHAQHRRQAARLDGRARTGSRPSRCSSNMAASPRRSRPISSTPTTSCRPAPSSCRRRPTEARRERCRGRARAAREASPPAGNVWPQTASRRSQ